MTHDLTSQDVAVLCVDDNPRIAEALRTKLSRTDGFRWGGWLPRADQLVLRAPHDGIHVVLLDLDLPGRDPFDAMLEFCRTCPDVKIVVFSGHVRKDLIDRVIECGAWGYASKNDGESALLDVLRRVVAGEFAMSPEVRSTWSA